MQVRDLREILDRFAPEQKLRVVMTGTVLGPNPEKTFADTDLPEVKSDERGVIELRFDDMDGPHEP